MIAGDDLELFERSVAHAVEAADVDAALTDLGWPDALADDPRAAIATLFTAQGRANATSSALTWVLADALGLPANAVIPLSAGGGRHVLWPGPSVREGRTVEGLDPSLGLIEVTDPDAAAESVPRNAAAEALGRLALAHELVGASRAMLELARTHALERIQFGVPISSFQAVRHRLAEALLAIEAAGAAIDGAWHDGTPFTAAIAKAVAGRSARTTARHAQQVLAGVGFTTEHALHRYVRRWIALDQLLGDTRTLTREVGQQLLDARALPAILPL